MTSDFILYAVFLIIQHKTNSLRSMERFFLSISNLESLEIFRPDKKEWEKALYFMKKYNLDFDDALVVASMVANKIKKLVSFDKHFDKVKEIETTEPRQLLP